MLENQIVPKSSEQSSDLLQGNVSLQEIALEGAGRIYFDTVQALADFDAESKKTAEIETQSNSRVAKYIANARLLIAHKEMPLAMNLLRQASNQDSKNPVVLSLLGECLERMGRLDEALVSRRVMVSVSYGFNSLFSYATTLYKLGKDQEALDKYYEALSVLSEENEHLFELYKNMGNIFVRSADFDGAEEYYNKAYTLNPLSDVLLVNFGTLEVQRQDYDKSLFCFRKAVEINSENDKAWVGLAMVHSQFGDVDLAWANLETAIDINPQNRTAIHLAANWGIRDHKVQKAIEAVQAYLSGVEQDEDMSLVLINLFCTAGQFENALLEIERVLLWNPDHQEVRELRKKLSGMQSKVA